MDLSWIFYMDLKKMHTSILFTSNSKTFSSSEQRYVFLTKFHYTISFFVIGISVFI
jgi:hypothetical protein